MLSVVPVNHCVRIYHTSKHRATMHSSTEKWLQEIGSNTVPCNRLKTWRSPFVTSILNCELGKADRAEQKRLLCPILDSTNHYEVYNILDVHLHYTITTLIYDLELSRRLDSMKSSRANSHVRHLYVTDVSRTISVIIIRDLMCPIMIRLVSCRISSVVSVGRCRIACLLRWWSPSCGIWWLFRRSLGLCLERQ